MIEVFTYKAIDITSGNKTRIESDKEYSMIAIGSQLTHSYLSIAHFHFQVDHSFSLKVQHFSRTPSLILFLSEFFFLVGPKHIPLRLQWLRFMKMHRTIEFM